MLIFWYAVSMAAERSVEPHDSGRAASARVGTTSVGLETTGDSRRALGQPWCGESMADMWVCWQCRPFAPSAAARGATASSGPSGWQWKDLLSH